MSSPADPLETPFQAHASPPDGATAFDCPLCGARFSHGALVCGSCPLNAGCDIVKCPQCGYQFPRSSKVVEWVLRVARRASGGSRG